jgi:hypothetical protein
MAKSRVTNGGVGEMNPGSAAQEGTPKALLTVVLIN